MSSKLYENLSVSLDMRFLVADMVTESNGGTDLAGDYMSGDSTSSIPYPE